MRWIDTGIEPTGSGTGPDIELQTRGFPKLAKNDDFRWFWRFGSKWSLQRSPTRNYSNFGCFRPPLSDLCHSEIELCSISWQNSRIVVKNRDKMNNSFAMWTKRHIGHISHNALLPCFEGREIRLWTQFLAKRIISIRKMHVNMTFFKKWTKTRGGLISKWIKSHSSIRVRHSHHVTTWLRPWNRLPVVHFWTLLSLLLQQINLERGNGTPKTGVGIFQTRSKQESQKKSRINCNHNPDNSLCKARCLTVDDCAYNHNPFYSKKSKLEQNGYLLWLMDISVVKRRRVEDLKPKFPEIFLWNMNYSRVHMVKEFKYAKVPSPQS